MIHEETEYEFRRCSGQEDFEEAHLNSEGGTFQAFSRKKEEIRPAHPSLR